MNTVHNVLLITLDDMNHNSHDFLRHHKESLTPHMDALKQDSLVFNHSHVTIAVCQPSRSVLMTGKYPHHNGAEGFEAISDGVTPLSAVLHDQGYYTGIIGKVNHLAPRDAFLWDEYVPTLCPEENWGRDPERYYFHTRRFLQTALEKGQPFFLMANSHDPHRPFAGSDDELKEFGAHMPITHTYTVDDVVAPGFLPDLPEVRTETAQYLTSVHRGDRSVGEILRALKELGLYEQTIIMVLSDNGMAVPFSKANCYYHSTKSPFCLRWPGHSGKRTTEALVSGIDYMPTILDMLGLTVPFQMDGQSLTHLFQPGDDSQYDDIFTFFFKTANNPITKRELHFPMRAVQDKKYVYIYNPWSDGETKFVAESLSGLTYKAMEKAAETDETIAQRVQLYRLRVREELYDLEQDPNALHNLAEEPTYAQTMAHYRNRMQYYLESTQDPLIEAFHRQIQ